MPSATSNWASNALTPRMGNLPKIPCFLLSSSKEGTSASRAFRLTMPHRRLKKWPQIRPRTPRDKKVPTMTEPAHEKLKVAGWTEVETSGFLNLIGPLWERVFDGNHEYAILAEHKHHNRRDRVQGGVLMTLADRASGMIARLVSGRPTLATVQMDVLFIDAGPLG